MDKYRLNKSKIFPDNENYLLIFPYITYMIQHEIILQSTISCPNCGHQKEETMPTDACQFFYECENCHTLLKPKQGDCCVYCSYGSMACPSIQQSKGCC